MLVWEGTATILPEELAGINTILARPHRPHCCKPLMLTWTLVMILMSWLA